MSTVPTTESALPAQARAKTPTKTPNDREGFRQAMSWLAHLGRARLVAGLALFASSSSRARCRSSETS